MTHDSYFIVSQASSLPPDSLDIYIVWCQLIQIIFDFFKNKFQLNWH